MQAAARLEFERAAALRDQMAALNDIQSRQVMTRANQHDDVDVLALAESPGEFCIALMFVRGGQVLGATNYFPRSPIADGAGVLSAFLAQHYLEREAPPRLMLSRTIEDAAGLAAAFSERAGRKVIITRPTRGVPQRWVRLAQQNADNALAMRGASRASLSEQLDELAGILQLAQPPARIECFDVSHTQGEAANAGCVVFGPEGPLKAEYRRYNIEDIEPGDDYAALRQALARRFRRRRERGRDHARPAAD